MGSFNISCSLTKINIYNDDEMMVFPLLSECVYENKKFSKKLKDGTQYTVEVTPPMCENVYSSENWSHMLPFKAVYNDYGFWEKENYKDPITKAFLDYLIENAVVPDDASDDSDFEEAHQNYKEKNYEEAMKNFGNLMHCEQLYISGGQNPGRYRLVKFAAVDMKIYKIIEQEKSVITEIAQKTKDLDTELAELQKAIKNADPKNGMLSLYSAGRKSHLIKNLIEESKSYNSAFTGTYIDEFIMDLAEGKRDIKKIKKEILIPALKNLVIQQWIRQTLSHIWAPVNYAGQNYSNKDVAKFLHQAAKVAIEKDEEHEYSYINSDDAAPVVTVKKGTFDLEIIMPNGEVQEKQIQLTGTLKLADFTSTVHEKIELEVNLNPSDNKAKPGLKL